MTNPTYNWREGVHDEASLRLAFRAWDNLMFEDSAGEYTQAQRDEIGRQLACLECAMEAHGHTINENGQYVPVQRSAPAAAQEACSKTEPTTAVAQEVVAWQWKLKSDEPDEWVFMTRMPPASITDDPVVEYRALYTAPVAAAPVEAIAREEEAHLETITRRDDAEEALGDMFTAATGRIAEWSSAWGYSDAIEEVEEHVAALERKASTPAAPVDLTSWAAHYSIHPAAVEALNSMLASVPAAPVVPNGKLVGWWNGITPGYDGQGSPSIRWGADAENSGHDIPLYDGYNPIHYQQPVQAEAQHPRSAGDRPYAVPRVAAAACL